MKKKILALFAMLLMVFGVLSGINTIASNAKNDLIPLVSEDFESGNLKNSAFKAELTSSWQDGFSYGEEKINGKLSFKSPKLAYWNIFLTTDTSKLFIGKCQEITVTCKIKFIEPFESGGLFYIEARGGDADYRYLRFNQEGTLGECGAQGGDNGQVQGWHFYPNHGNLMTSLGDGSYFVKFVFITSCDGYSIKFGLNTGENIKGQITIDDINIYKGKKCNDPTINSKIAYTLTGNETLGELGDDIVNKTENEFRGDYHFEPSTGFNNDINGPIYYNGMYHVFYQYTKDPYGNGVKEWGHIVSTDCVNWEELPLALTYDAPYDVGGVWSGNAFLDKNGRPVIIYYAYATGICLAYPKDLSDPYLTEWVKEESNPVLKKQDFTPGHPYMVYDPSNVWIKDGKYWMITGNKDQNQRPMCYLFSSDDLLSWEYVGEFISPDSNMNSFDDFACPNLMLINEEEDIYLFTFSSHHLGTRYYTGKIVNNRFEIMNYGTFANGGGCEMGSVCCYDEFGRVLFFNWTRESRSNAEFESSGWNGGMTMTRVISCDDNGILTIVPHENYKNIESNEKTIENLLLNDRKEVLDGFNGQNAHINLDLTIDGASKAGIKVFASKDGSEETLVYYDANTRQIVIDYSNSSLNTYDYVYYIFPFVGERINCTIQKSLPFYIGEHLILDIYLDGSFLEVYVDGKFSLSQRVYPSLATSNGVVAFSEGGNALFNNISMWDMKVEAGE